MARKNSYIYANRNLIGEKHGKLEVIGKSDRGRSWWICKCECGNVVELLAHRFYDYKSCGCLEKENKLHLTDHTKTHGMSKSRLYSIWCKVKERCNNPNIEHYNRYGGRGIRICQEWEHSFESFKKWAYESGFRDSSTGKEQSLDRIDVNGNYEPDNCRWITQKEQFKNTTRNVYIDCNGTKMVLCDFCEKYDIKYHKFVVRYMKKGLSADEIVRVWNFNHDKHDGYYSVKEASNYYDVTTYSIMKWIKKKQLKAEKIGNSWFIPIGQEIKRPVNRNKLGQFISSDCYYERLYQQSNL